MISDTHSKGPRLGSDVAANAAHAQDAQDLALGVVAQRGRRRAAPLAGSQGVDADGEVAQGADEQPDVDVGGGIVDGGGSV